MSGARVLVVRSDNAGDVLLCGPAVRAVAATAGHVVFLAGPRGAAAARLLPGVDEVAQWETPWIEAEPPPLDRAHAMDLVRGVAALRVDRALVFTSYHQSALPMAALLRMAGVRWIGAISHDYPGSLLDLRHRPDETEHPPEPERMLALAEAAGFRLPDTDDGRLAVRLPLPPTGLRPGYVVLHPGATAPARVWPPSLFREAVAELAEGHEVVVTGAPGERGLTAYVAGSRAVDLGGRTSLHELAAVLGGAAAVVVGNTGPAHLAAAVGTPVVSLFAPVVPAGRWAPYRVPSVLLGDQEAACRGSRARTCPTPGHPCLSSVTAQDVVQAVRELVA